MHKTFTLDKPAVIGAVNLAALPEDLVEALTTSGAILHAMERPAGTYRIRQTPDCMRAVFSPVKRAGDGDEGHTRHLRIA